MNTGPNTLTDEIIAAMMAHIQAVFRDTAPLILSRAGKETSSDKHDGSPVTDTDIEVEKTVVASMQGAFPEVPVLGEETGYGDTLPQTCWLIDPIDGTQSFMKNIPVFTCMALLIHDDEALACIIYNPSTNDMYTARKNNGAFKNNTKLDLTSTQMPNTAAGKAWAAAQLDTIMAPANITTQLAPTGAGNGFCMVADGRSAARFDLHARGHIHDYATGMLLVTEAGGAVVPIKDTEQTIRTRSFVTCHPELEDLIRNNLQQLRDLEDSEE